MDTFYIEPGKFWELFDKPDIDVPLGGSFSDRPRNIRPYSDRQTSEVDLEQPDNGQNFGKRLKANDKKPRVLAETEAGTRFDNRYIIMYGPHKPGKKTKTWQGDGYLTMIGQMAHVCDLKGRMLEEPTILDDIDYKSVEDMEELMIGNTEIQIIELDKRR